MGFTRLIARGTFYFLSVISKCKAKKTPEMSTVIFWNFALAEIIYSRKT